MYSYVGQVFVTQKQVRVGKIFKVYYMLLSIINIKLKVMNFKIYIALLVQYLNTNLCPDQDCSIFFVVLKTLQPMHDE